MFSANTAIAIFIGLIVLLFCIVCFHGIKNHEDDLRALANTDVSERTTAPREITKRTNARSQRELATVRNSADAPIIVRKPPPMGWIRSTAKDSSLPPSPKLDGSTAVVPSACPYPVDNPTMSHLVFPSQSRNSAPYPVETTSNMPLPIFKKVTENSAPYPIPDFPSDPLSHPSKFTHTFAFNPVGTSNEDIRAGDPKGKPTLSYSSNVSQRSAPYPIEEIPELSIQNLEKNIQPSAPPVEELSQKNLQYTLEMGENIEQLFHPEVNKSTFTYPAQDSHQGLSNVNPKSGNRDQSYYYPAEPMEIRSNYPPIKTEPAEGIRLLVTEVQRDNPSEDPEEDNSNICSASYYPCLKLGASSLIQPEKPGFKKEPDPPYPAEVQMPGTYTSEEVNQAVDTFSVVYNPPEPGFKAASRR